jgi:hypothetical protein
MLLLNVSQVQFQEVIKFDSQQPESQPSVAYQEKLFSKLKDFPKEESAAAEKLLRQLAINKSNLYLMLEEAESYTIWYQDDRLQPYVDNSIDHVELKDLVREMRDIGGIKVKDRRYRLSVYPRCFVGSDAVDWLKKRFGISSEDAVKLGQRLIDEKLLHHVTDGHPFENGYFFYRFFWDEEQ